MLRNLVVQFVRMLVASFRDPNAEPNHSSSFAGFVLRCLSIAQRESVLNRNLRFIHTQGTHACTAGARLKSWQTCVNCRSDMQALVVAFRRPCSRFNLNVLRKLVPLDQILYVYVVVTRFSVCRLVPGGAGAHLPRLHLQRAQLRHDPALRVRAAVRAEQTRPPLRYRHQLRRRYVGVSFLGAILLATKQSRQTRQDRFHCHLHVQMFEILGCLSLKSVEPPPAL